jgi:hypothetical protein
MNPRYNQISADEVRTRGLQILQATSSMAVASSPSTSTNSTLPRRPKPHTQYSHGSQIDAVPTLVKPLQVMGGYLMPPPPLRRCGPVIHLVHEQERGRPKHKPAIYGWESDRNVALAGKIGSAAYYKSQEFYRKKLAGVDHVPGRKSSATNDSVDNGNMNDDMENAESETAKSLIMIFGRTTVRRANTNNKFYLRMQRYNKRA